MDSENRAFLLGVAGGLAFVAVGQLSGQLFADRFFATGPQAVAEAGLRGLLALAVIPGFVTAGAYRLDVRRPSSWPAFSGLVGVGAGAAVVAANVVLTSSGDPGLYLTPWSVGSALVNALPVAVYAWVGALAGFLLAEQNA